MKNKLISGQLVSIKIGNLVYTPDGFSNGAICVNGKMCLYEEIDLFTFPSFNDFYGRKILVKDGDIGTINKFVGRPSQISRDPKWFSYDVYEILIHGTFVKVFRQNLSTL